jgi:phenylacetate-CoA ligase
MGDRCAYLWGMPTGLSRFQQLKMHMYDRAYNRYMLDCFQMTQQNLGEYAARLKKIKPRYVVSYVNPLVTLARWAIENKVNLEGPSAVLTGAEALSGPQRELISGAFRVPISNTYGCREVMLIAAECQQGSLHCNADHLVLETVGEGGADSKESAGRVALTDLHNYAMPLIRYLNGDAAARSAATCACGLEFPLLDRIEGRILDAIRTVDGRVLPGEFFPYLLKDFPCIREFQVVQKSLESLELKLVPHGSIPSAQMDRVLEGIRSKLGREIQIAVNIVEHIPRTPSGKLRVTVSMLGDSR